jgi:VIT1/CCC1 family predicted Fe2+/Mn2+ transporter
MNTCQTVSSSPWTDAAIIATALGALVFVVSYAWVTRGGWKDSAVGLNIMSFMAAVLVVSLLATASIVWGTNWPNRNIIRTAAWSLIAACIWWRVVILFRVQHRSDTTT